MREPKFSDAWCFGKEFEANTKICRVCLANKACQKIFFRKIGVAQAPVRTVLQLSKRPPSKINGFAN
jgi:hypothetical protein